MKRLIFAALTLVTIAPISVAQEINCDYPISTQAAAHCNNKPEEINPNNLNSLALRGCRMILSGYTEGEVFYEINQAYSRDISYKSGRNGVLSPTDLSRNRDMADMYTTMAKEYIALGLCSNS